MVQVPDINGYLQYVNITVFTHGIDPFNAEREVYFMLHTRKNPTGGQILKDDSEVLQQSNFNASLETRILIHGWLNDHTSEFNTKVRDAYLQNGDFNVVS